MIRNGRPYTNENGHVDDALLTDEPLEVQQRVCDWIHKGIIGAEEENAHNTSYGMKHYYHSQCGDYLTNNQFKDAMMICGFYPVDENELNWTYRISEDSPAFTGIPFENRVARMNGFFGWMMQFVGEDSERGMLAMDMKRDPDFPAPCGYKEGIQYLSKVGAHEFCYTEFEAGWDEWSKGLSEKDKERFLK